MKNTFNLEAMVSEFDNLRLKRSEYSMLIKNKHVPQPMSLREVTRQTDVSTTTLSRLQRQVALPDMKTLLAVCDWMGVSPKKYFESK
jgi:transcriptional regulator with XRE-family HTH domain